jgi:hypothetical protein
VVTALAATPAAKGFTAVVYVVQDSELQRRDITVGANGSVTEKTKTLVPNLPVPYVL